MEYIIKRHRHFRTKKAVIHLLPDSCDRRGKLFHFSRCIGRHSKVAYFSWLGLWCWFAWGGRGTA